MDTSPETQAAAAALDALNPSDREVKSILDFLCGFSPDAVHAAIAHVERVRAYAAERANYGDQ